MDNPVSSTGNPTASRIKVWRPQGFAGVEVEIFENAQGYVDPKTVLDEYHFNVTFRGSAQVMYAGARHRFRYTYPLAMVQQPGEAYAMDARGEALSGWSLSLRQEGLQHLGEALALPLPRFPEMLTPAASNTVLANQLKVTIEAFDLPATQLERESNLLDMVELFSNHCADSSTSERRPGREHRAVRQTREVLHAHFADEVSIETLAQRVGFSQGYLLRAFKHEVGVTPHAYQIALRVDCAKDLLASGVDISQVAAETGFHDQSHLTRTFKKYVQTTPGRFRLDTLAGTEGRSRAA